MKYCGVLICMALCGSISEVFSRVVMEKAKKMKPNFIGFPPGRPHSENVKGICAFREYRPQHLTKCFLNTGFDYDRFAHHLEAMDSIEKGFGQCCKKNKDVHICAEEKACINVWMITGLLV